MRTQHLSRAPEVRQMLAALLVGSAFSAYSVAAESRFGEPTAEIFVQGKNVPESTELLLLVHQLSSPKAPVREYRP